MRVTRQVESHGPPCRLSQQIVNARTSVGSAIEIVSAQAGESSFDIPAELWTQIARLATEVAVHAQALADRGEEV